MTVFYDMDTTLIHLHKNDTDEFVPISTKFGKTSCWMKKSHYDMLSEIMKKANVVPITSRTINSALDITLPQSPTDILIENGCIWLHNNTIQLEWLQKSEKKLEEIQKEIQTLRIMMASFGYVEKWGSPFIFNFQKTSTIISDNAINILKSQFQNNFIISQHKSNKEILFIPKTMDKKNAVEDYILTTKDKHIIISGDSLADYGMLSLPYETIGPFKSNAKHKYLGKIEDNPYAFTEFVLKKTLELIESNTSNP